IIPVPCRHLSAVLADSFHTSHDAQIRFTRGVCGVCEMKRNAIRYRPGIGRRVTSGRVSDGGGEAGGGNWPGSVTPAPGTRVCCRNVVGAEVARISSVFGEYTGAPCSGT